MVLFQDLAVLLTSVAKFIQPLHSKWMPLSADSALSGNVTLHALSLDESLLLITLSTKSTKIEKSMRSFLLSKWIWVKHLLSYMWPVTHTVPSSTLFLPLNLNFRHCMLRNVSESCIGFSLCYSSKTSISLPFPKRDLNALLFAPINSCYDDLYYKGTVHFTMSYWKDRIS